MKFSARNMVAKDNATGRVFRFWQVVFADGSSRFGGVEEWRPDTLKQEWAEDSESVSRRWRWEPLNLKAEKPPRVCRVYKHA